MAIGVCSVNFNSTRLQQKAVRVHLHISVFLTSGYTHKGSSVALADNAKCAMIRTLKIKSIFHDRVQSNVINFSITHIITLSTHCCLLKIGH